jgi:hypothetical protein
MDRGLGHSGRWSFQGNKPRSAGGVKSEMDKPVNDSRSIAMNYVDRPTKPFKITKIHEIKKS